ncbi:MAG: hypothetical protein WA906_04190 [Pacificimonas sp.]
MSVLTKQFSSIFGTAIGCLVVAIGCADSASEPVQPDDEISLADTGEEVEVPEFPGASEEPEAEPIATDALTETTAEVVATLGSYVPEPPDITPSSSLALASDGVVLTNLKTERETKIPFGRPRKTVLTGMENVTGRAQGTLVASPCPVALVSVAQIGGGLSLSFDGPQFSGWTMGPSASPRAFRTLAGIGLGSDRAALEDAYPVKMIEDSGLGHEFTTGDISGLLSGPDEDATVERLWAGTTCLAR